MRVHLLVASLCSAAAVMVEASASVGHRADASFLRNNLDIAPTSMIGANGDASSSSIRNQNASSWWHAMDGIPFLLSKRPKRKLSKKIIAEPSFDANNPENGNFHHQVQRVLAFGDYADHSFQCPATTTCPIVCVASIDDCPSDSRCPGTHPDGDAAFPSDHEYELCADGTCADLTTGEICDSELESPCECDSLPVICAKQVDQFPTCKDRFQELYDGYSKCLEEQEELLPQVSFTGPWFMACYIGLAAVTALMLLWCAWNQRWSSVDGSVASMQSANAVVASDAEEIEKGSSTMGAKRRATMEDEDKTNESSGRTANTASLHMHENWTQTGYKTTIIGMFLYSLIVLTHIIIQFLLLFLTIEYYKQQEAIFNLGDPIFLDEIQVLMAFEIVWMVGFVWFFFLKYPASIHSLFLRRCLPEEANHIAVSAPVQNVDTHYESKMIVKLLNSLGMSFTSILSFVYSDGSQNPSTGRNKVTFCKIRVDEKTGSQYFYFRMRRYIYSDEQKKYIPGCFSVTKDATIGTWLDHSYLHQGLSSEEASKRLSIVGPNVLDLKKPTLLGSIKNEFSKSFYIYQNFLVWTWAPFWYYYMAIVNSCVRITGGLVVSIFQYTSDLDLYQLMVVSGEVEVLRDGGKVVTLNQTDVVPGDIVKLTPGLAYFDMVVLQAKPLLVDESALTGEVHPIAKIELDAANSNFTYSRKKNKSSTISAGTTILECEVGEGTVGDLAIVTQTGSFTSKGELLSDVLSYERHKFKFDTEVKIILAILAVEAAILLAVVFSVIEDHWVYSWFYAMFVVGTCLPPLLPTVFVVSVGISSKRLQRKRITCTDSRGILVAGKVRKAFFDKTGTLTNQGLDFVSALRGEEFMNLKATAENENPYLGTSVIDHGIQRGLAVCHTLHLSVGRELIGAAVDRQGFKAVPTAQLLDENTVSFEGDTIKYLKRFEFDHHSMTQSVIIRHGEESIVYTKGSPESISKICVQSSLPPNFEEKARQSARDGIYQLAIATSTFASNKSMNEVTREDVEKNVMKEDTPTVIRELREGKVDSAIVTGDNVLTGIYIAKKAGIIQPNKSVIIADSIRDDQIQWLNAHDDTPAPSPLVAELEEFSKSSTLAMTGEVWLYLLKYDPKSALEYAKYTRVFGRCTPNDKVSIVSTFVEIGEITLMCGDGGNDCGALKAAHVGIALSDAEASVVAPFTSLDKSISSVTEVLKEGRCALASAIASYKYMIMYGQVESINQVANAYLSVTFTEWCWVFMDGIWTIIMAFTLPLAKAAKTLSTKRPTASLLGPHTLTSSCGILAINFIFLVISLLLLWGQDWFQCRMWDSDDVSNTLTIGDNYETSVIFIISGYQYLSSAAAYNFGYTFRANWFRNYVFVSFFALFSALHFAATLTNTKLSCIWRLNCDNDHAVRWVTSPDPEPIYNNFNTTVMPMSFRVVLCVLMIANLIANCAWDYFVVNMALPKIGSKLGVVDDSQHATKNQIVASQKKEME